MQAIGICDVSAFLLWAIARMGGASLGVSLKGSNSLHLRGAHCVGLATNGGNFVSQHLSIERHSRPAQFTSRLALIPVGDRERPQQPIALIAAGSPQFFAAPAKQRG